jgi:arylsulfatase A-like enzyme
MKVMPATRKRIGANGVRFTRSYASFPLCCPSRATYLTGLYAHNHGVLSNHPPEGGAPAFDDSATTAVALDAAGYRTGWVGKYLNGYSSLAHQDPPYVPPGFDWWRAPAAPRTMYNWLQVMDGELKRWGAADRDYQTDVYARQAERFIDQSAGEDRPFFLTVMPFAPHVETRLIPGDHNPRGARRDDGAFKQEPLPRPPSFNEDDVSDKPAFVSSRPKFDVDGRTAIRRLYRDRLWTLLAVDDLVVRVMTALRRDGLLDETLVIFTSDNGYMLGEHRLKGKGTIYEEAARVPLLMREPDGVAAPGTVIRSPVVNVDLAATIYDFTGVDPRLESEGYSLLDVANVPGVFADRDILLETRSTAAVRAHDWLWAEHDFSGGPEREFYDMTSDPYQLSSLHDDPAYQGTRADLADRLDDLRNCDGSECL